MTETDVQAFLDAHPSLAMLLLDMRPPLRLYFGPYAERFDIVTDPDDGRQQLRLTLQLPHASASLASHARYYFDHAWWSHHCHRAEDLVLIDYALQEDTP